MRDGRFDRCFLVHVFSASGRAGNCSRLAVFTTQQLSKGRHALRKSVAPVRPVVPVTHATCSCPSARTLAA